MITAFIHHCYEPHSTLPADDGFFKLALADIEYFDISTQIYCLLKQQRRLEHMPLYFRNRLQKRYNDALFRNVFIKHELEKIFNNFEGAEITAIPLKGVRFAEKYFGQTGARSTADIDLLIKPTDKEKATACIKSLGFTIEGERYPFHFHTSFAKLLPDSPYPLAVELHWDLLAEGTSRFKIEELWYEASPIQPYRHIKELSEYHTFYMICLHGWKHGLNSMKYFMDIIQLIHTVGGNLDYTRLFHDAVKHQTYNRMLSTLSIVYHQFPYLEKIKPLPLQLHRPLSWWDYDTTRGVKGRSLMNYIRFVRYQWFDFDSPKHSLSSSSHYIQALLKKYHGSGWR